MVKYEKPYKVYRIGNEEPLLLGKVPRNKLKKGELLKHQIAMTTLAIPYTVIDSAAHKLGLRRGLPMDLRYGVSANAKVRIVSKKPKGYHFISDFKSFKHAFKRSKAARDLLPVIVDENGKFKVYSRYEKEVERKFIKVKHGKGKAFGLTDYKKELKKEVFNPFKNLFKMG